MLPDGAKFRLNVCQACVFGGAPGIDTVQRLAAALGCTLHDLLPLTAPPDDLAILRDQVQRQVEALMVTKDRQTFSLLAQFLARLSETTAR